MRKARQALLVGKVRKASMSPSNLCSCLGGRMALATPGLAATLLLTLVVRHLPDCLDTRELGPGAELDCPPATVSSCHLRLQPLI